MAKGNTIRHNVFIHDSDMRITFPKSSDYTFSKNVLVADGKITFEFSEGEIEWKKNVIYSTHDKILHTKLDEYEGTGTEELALPDNNSTNDPMLKNEDGNIMYDPDSVVYQLGIKSIDVSDAGLK